MTVTGITEYRKGKYKIYLNDQFAFVLYKGELSEYGIIEGEELPDDIINDIRTEVLGRRARLRAMNLLKSRDYTEFMLRRKLKESLYPDDIIDDAVGYVMSYGYVDDVRYARDYVTAHILTRSRRELISKLKEKGIDDRVISMVMSEFSDEGEEEELIEKLIRKRIARVTGWDEVSRRKLLSYMYGKGFPIDKTERVLDKVLLDITL
ncbi:MAG: recombination regulator RecX [Lachnospiraceae bacterium]|nr:recombination regulator RecX [Lachnospiraceae bacterium]